ncbi:sigma-70 family RNA polymerase sigma factor [Psychrobacillus sp. MER TA 171]|uniref:sigma-70 family RNA polymerase sigma factor n=1 Tax=Psychrobacillus sp. MER TA 171 TaxID=2939577 RepID=UPI00203E8C88|nr:sigma-70 family RNA polymerase sigma factor [Psychrobacillus sp. MER TA 171]MCM3359077.1 sigma-70 family RNA polymerase sigma factor [Psychrobacillus sp. MER TA 171]
MEHLVRKAITGDDDAFLQLMQIHRDVLYKTAFIYLKNEHDVLEALQEVTFRAYTKRHQVKEPSFFQTWLVRILLNYCMDTLKKQGNLLSLNEDVEKEQQSSNQDLMLALRELPSAQRELIHLKYFNDLKVSEIARRLQIPEGTVKSRLHHTLKKIRVFMGERGGDV